MNSVLKKNQKQNWFLYSFPVPSFLSMSSAGLSFGDDALRLIKFKESRKGLILDKFEKMNLAEGIIESGEIKKPDELKKILRFLKKKHSLEFVNVSLPEDKAYLFTKRFFDVKEENIKDIIELSLEEDVPVSRQEAVFDFEICEKDPAGKWIDASVSVYPKDIVNGFLDILKCAGLVPFVVEAESQCVADSVIAEEDEETSLIVNFSDLKTGVYVVSDGVVQFTTSINIGGRNLTSLIKKNLSVSEEEAEKLKKESSLVKNYDSETLFASLMATTSALKDEINRSYTFWQTHKGAESPEKLIKKIVLTGANSSIGGFDDYISSYLGIKAVLADVWTNVFDFNKFIPALTFENSLDFSAAIGAALHK